MNTKKILKNPLYRCQKSINNKTSLSKTSSKYFQKYSSQNSIKKTMFYNSRKNYKKDLIKKKSNELIEPKFINYFTQRVNYFNNIREIKKQYKKCNSLNLAHNKSSSVLNSSRLLFKEDSNSDINLNNNDNKDISTDLSYYNRKKCLKHPLKIALKRHLHSNEKIDENKKVNLKQIKEDKKVNILNNNLYHHYMSHYHLSKEKEKKEKKTNYSKMKKQNLKNIKSNDLLNFSYNKFFDDDKKEIRYPYDLDDDNNIYRKERREELIKKYKKNGIFRFYLNNFKKKTTTKYNPYQKIIDKAYSIYIKNESSDNCDENKRTHSKFKNDFEKNPGKYISFDNKINIILKLSNRTQKKVNENSKEMSKIFNKINKTFYLK